MRLAIPLIVALAQLAMSGRAAMAQSDTPVAILELELSGDAAPELRDRVVASIAEGVVASGADVITLDEVRAALEQEPNLAGCTSTTCLARIGEMVGAERFVRGNVQATGAAYTVTLELLTASKDVPAIGRVTEACTVCTMTELARRVKVAAEKLASGAGSSTTVEITSQPAGAMLTIDGEPVGAAPFSGDLKAGEHTIAAAMPGYHAATQTVEIKAGQEATQRLAMTLIPEAPPESDAPIDYGIWKWVSAGGAIAAITTGVVLIAIDGGGTCTPDEGQRQCPKLRDTQTAGILTIGAGVGLGALSGWMFYKDSERRAAAAIAPQGDGAVATVTIQF